MSDLAKHIMIAGLDDRAENFGNRLRDRVCMALGALDKRTRDIKIVRYALAKLDRDSRLKETF